VCIKVVGFRVVKDGVESPREAEAENWVSWARTRMYALDDYARATASDAALLADSPGQALVAAPDPDQLKLLSIA
jgi:hypothetical protein